MPHPPKTVPPDLAHSFGALHTGARAAIEQQWAGVAAGGLPCGSSVVDGEGRLVAVGRNHAYDRAGALETRLRLPLQHTRLAHAEMNALALIPTDADHAALTLWTTQHPCAMCAAALRFVGVGRVCYVADDPSDVSLPEVISATQGDLPYERLGDRLWWTICNLLFLYNSAVQRGETARNLILNRERYSALVGLTLACAHGDALGQAARSGTGIVSALLPMASAIEEAARHAP